MRAYHHFSLNRELKHLVIGFLIILIPLFALFAFSLVSGIAFGTVLDDLGISMWRLFVALFVSVVIAWILVVSLVRGKTTNFALSFFDVMQSLPTFTILPIAVHFFGNCAGTIILFLIITIIWPVIFSIVSSLKQAESSITEAVFISRIRGFNFIRYYLFPITAPGIVTGAIIGLGDGWEALIATEIILEAKTGLGPFFQSFSNNSSMTLFGILVFLSVIYTINKFIWLPLLEKSHEYIQE